LLLIRREPSKKTFCYKWEEESSRYSEYFSSYTMNYLAFVKSYF
jgi:hypothetical protein